MATLTGDDSGSGERGLDLHSSGEKRESETWAVKHHSVAAEDVNLDSIQNGRKSSGFAIRGVVPPRLGIQVTLEKIQEVM